MTQRELVDLNNAIIDVILNSMPKNIKPVTYMMDLLELSRESVYRRLRKEIPFSIDELSKLSLDLGFSIDKVVGGVNNERVFFDLQSKTSINSSNSFVSTFELYNHYLQMLVNAEKSCAQVMLNHIPLMFSAYFDVLFKFSYFKWLTEKMETTFKSSFSDLVLPSEIVTLKESIFQNSKKIRNCVLILSPNIFLSLVKELQYYYQKRLIKKEELEILKESMHEVIYFIERIAQSGGLVPENRIDIYLSTLHLTSNIGYLEYDGLTETHLWLYTTMPMIIHNAEICETQKKWLRTVKMHSTLISLSNEILQSAFFDRQHEQIEEFIGGQASNHRVIL